MTEEAIRRIENESICGNCGGALIYDIIRDGFKCFQCGTMSFAKEVNMMFYKGRLIEFDPILTASPMF